MSVINLFGFNNSTGAIQEESAKLGIMIAFTLIPAILILISAFFIRYFPLSGPEWSKKKEELHQIHVEKEKAYLDQMRNQDT